MARRTQIMLEDDLTGELLEEGSGQTVEFGLDGTRYEIDLSTDNAAQLREDFARYVGAGHKVSTSTGRRSGGTSSTRSTTVTAKRRNLAEIREWAKAHGHEVSERGRIAAAVVEAYDAAH